MEVPQMKRFISWKGDGFVWASNLRLHPDIIEVLFAYNKARQDLNCQSVHGRVIVQFNNEF